MDNKRNKFTMEFDIGDAASVIHAFRLMAATAMACGYPNARRKMQEYAKVALQFAPPEMDRFTEEIWTEIAENLLEATSFKLWLVRSHRGNWNERKGLLRITIVKGDKSKTWKDESWRKDLEPDDPVIQQVYDWLEMLAPMDLKGELDRTLHEDARW